MTDSLEENGMTGSVVVGVGDRFNKMMIENLARSIAPLDEKQVHEFITSETKSLKPNRWSKANDWMADNLYGLILAALVLCACLFFARTKTALIPALFDAAIITVIIFFVPSMIISSLARGGALWRIVPRADCRFVYNEEAMIRLIAASAEPRWEVEMLYRSTDKGDRPLATVVWLTYVDNGKRCRRGALATVVRQQ